MAAVQNGRQPGGGMRLESSVDSQESSLDTTATSQEQASDDEDDELLALRIAALESIKIKEAKAKADAKKPEFLIKSHPARGNLVSIVTCEDELKQGGEAKRNGSKLQSNRLASPPPSLPPPVLPVFDRTRPPPGFGGEVFVSEPLIPFPPPRRFSRSPRRWSRSPPPRRSPSPYRRRRSPSPLPLRRYRSRSPSPPPPRRRSPSPPGPRRRTGSASPPRRRSPPRRSAPRSPSPEFSEWETDTEDEEEKEGDEKEKEDDQEKKKEPVKEVSKTEIKKKVDAAEEDDGPDDFLKLDATAEVDEFSQFLNEFEDEVLDESKKKEAAVDVKKVKKDRPVTEKKVVDGKKLRKKVKPVRSPPPRPRSRSPRGGGSPLRWRKSSERRSPGGRFFMEERRGSRGSPGRKRIGQSPGVEPAAGGKRRSPNARSRSPEKRSSKPKERLGAPAKPKETALERKEREEKELKEKKEKEEQEYQERLSKLSTPEREIMEARKKKFEARSSVSEGKTKISLKTSQSTPSMALVTKKKATSDSGKVSGGLISASKRALEVSESKKVSEGTDSPEAKFDTGPKAKSAAVKADKFPRVEKDLEEPRRGGKADNKGEEEDEKLAQDRGMVTDLRVRLHKKKQEAVGKKVDKVASSRVGEEEEEEVSGRKVVPPGRTPPIASRLSQPRSERSVSRSPSPPPHKRKKRSSGEVKKSKAVEEDEELDDKPMLGGRRIIVARPRSLSPESAASSPENLQVITSNMKKGMKKSLSSRLGPVDPSVQQQFSEKEIYEEMLRQQERRRIAIEEKEIKKLKKAMKKKERLERKLKKHDKKESRKKSKKVLDDDSDFSEGDMLASLDLLKAKQEQLAQAPAKADVDSDEELYRFFEEPEPERKEKKGKHTAEEGLDEKKKKKVGRKRRTSDSGGEGKRSRRSSGEGGLRARLGRKVDKKVEEEDEYEVGRSGKVGKRHRKN